jgi:ABC-type transporter Mla subunit MlaD
VSRLSDLHRAVDGLARLAASIAREVRRGRDADFALLVELATELARQADRLAAVLAELDAVVARALQERPRPARDLVDALSPSHRRAAGGA